MPRAQAGQSPPLGANLFAGQGRRLATGRPWALTGSTPPLMIYNQSDATQEAGNKQGSGERRETGCDW